MGAEAGTPQPGEAALIAELEALLDEARTNARAVRDVLLLVADELRAASDRQSVQ